SLSIRQESGLKSAKIGDTMILRCFYEGDMAMHFSWYKQNLGDKLQLFSTIHYKYDRNATFYHEFKDNPRFSVQNGPKRNHLRISDMQLSDSGTYYCGNAYTNRVEFGKGVILIIYGVKINMPILQQSVSESVQPGDVVTLNCTIHTESCAGEDRVYWFRRGSGESPPGIMYTHGDRSDQCEKSPEAGSPTQSCVYNLPKRNLSLSDAGTYYCAVALCGEILFGNGTKLDIQEHYSPFDLSPTVLALVVSNIVLGTVTLLLAWALYKNLNRHHRGNYFTLYRNQDSDMLNYAAVSFTPKKNSSSSRRTRGKTSREDAVYSEVRYLQQE
uniref:Ig-like domain-containing protein n=1 Tax=Oncorhynchus tshawytscha TaxID=74940 RepID=A0A8C8GEL7_ONCTS